jgi:hypothetical protein
MASLPLVCSMDKIGRQEFDVRVSFDEILSPIIKCMGVYSYRICMSKKLIPRLGMPEGDSAA